MDWKKAGRIIEDMICIFAIIILPWFLLGWVEEIIKERE